MTSPRWIWAAVVLFYAAFFLWYDGLHCPLMPEETERYLALLAPQEGVDAQQLEWFRRFAQTDDGGEVYIVNLAEQRERPGVVPGVAAGESAAQLLSRYTNYFIPRLFPRAGYPMIVGTPIVPVERWGIPDEGWDMVAVIRHRSRRDLLEMLSARGMAEAHPYKIAALEKTVARRRRS